MPRSTVRALLVTMLLAGCSNATAGPASSPSPSPRQAQSARPDVLMTVVGGPAAGSYRSDSTSTSANCAHNADGSWRAYYAGSEPWFSIDLLASGHASEPGGSSEVALEVNTGAGYLWIDPAGIRGGDKPGRSPVTVEFRATPAGTTLVVTGTTPNRTPSGDGEVSRVELEVSCAIV